MQPGSAVERIAFDSGVFAEDPFIRVADLTAEQGLDTGVVEVGLAVFRRVAGRCEEIDLPAGKTVAQLFQLVLVLRSELRHRFTRSRRR